jgi:RNA polymerase sigma-70 factor (ECF subfamily)
MVTTKDQQAKARPAEVEIESGLDRLQETLWVAGAQQGDPEAFRSLVARYERQLLYYLTHFTANPEHAADALQEVWLIAFRRLKDLREPKAFGGWIYQIAHDKVVSFVRRETRREQLHEAFAEEQDPGEVHEDLLPDNAELVHRSLSHLSPEHREVLVLRFLEDLSLEQIAAALRCQLGTVKSRLHYGRQALRKILEEQSYD